MNSLEELYKKDHELVSGVFHSEEKESLIMMQFYKYKEDGIFHYCLKNDEETVVPRMVAECWKQKGMFSYDENQEKGRYSRIKIS